jgi:hypothetical protein
MPVTTDQVGEIGTVHFQIFALRARVVAHACVADAHALEDLLQEFSGGLDGLGFGHRRRSRAGRAGIEIATRRPGRTVAAAVSAAAESAAAGGRAPHAAPATALAEAAAGGAVSRLFLIVIHC